MNFDNWWDWDDDGSRGVATHDHTQKVPTGTHTGDIVKAEVKDLKFKITDDNETGTCLVVTWSKPGGYFPVESIVNLRWRGLIETICRAAGVAPPTRGQDWDVESLVGRVVTIDVENAVSTKGKEYQRVTRWHPSPSKPQPAAAAKRTPARTPAAKAHQEFTAKAADDDIPF